MRAAAPFSLLQKYFHQIIILDLLPFNSLSPQEYFYHTMKGSCHLYFHRSFVITSYRSSYPLHFDRSIFMTPFHLYFPHVSHNMNVGSIRNMQANTISFTSAICHKVKRTFSRFLNKFCELPEVEHNSSEPPPRFIKSIY